MYPSCILFGQDEKVCGQDEKHLLIGQDEKVFHRLSIRLLRGKSVAAEVGVQTVFITAIKEVLFFFFFQIDFSLRFEGRGVVLAYWQVQGDPTPRNV